MKNSMQVMVTIKSDHAFKFEKRSETSSEMKVLYHVEDRYYLFSRVIEDTYMKDYSLKQLEKKEYEKLILMYSDETCAQSGYKIKRCVDVKVSYDEYIRMENITVRADSPYQAVIDEMLERQEKDLLEQKKFEEITRERSLKAKVSAKNLAAFGNNVKLTKKFEDSLISAYNNFSRLDEKSKNVYREEIQNPNPAVVARALFDLGVEFGAVSPARLNWKKLKEKILKIC